MGQYVSMRRMYVSQDGLTNGMVEEKHILSKDVERAFRCVDRGFYFTDNEKNIAYNDAAWQSEHIHLSSPSIYALVLESLQLQPGHKFLNIGSGIGYLNTVSGLLLGTHGVNHGIEINQPVIDLALQKLNEFISNAAAIDYYNFCEPVFVHGNACQLMAADYYDRVYCGASVPPSESIFMKSLIKVNGVLVMPMDGHLLKIVRKSEHTWDVKRILDVSFTDLVTPKDSYKKVKFPPVDVLSLHDLCRLNIRSLLRENLKIQSPELKIRAKTKFHYEETSSDESDQDSDKLSTQPCSGNGHCNSFAQQSNNIPWSFESFSLLQCPLSLALSSDDDTESNFDIDSNSDIEEKNNTDLKTEENRLKQNLPRPTFTDTSDELNKRKSPEVGDVEQIKTKTDVENPKRFKLNSASSEKNYDCGPSTSLSWETVSDVSSSYSSPISESLKLSMENDAEEVNEDLIEDHDHFAEGLRLVFGNERIQNAQDHLQLSDHEARDLIKYRFANLCTINELSIRMKTKIDSLPIPTPLKNFLNYFRYN